MQTPKQWYRVWPVRIKVAAYMIWWGHVPDVEWHITDTDKNGFLTYKGKYFANCTYTAYLKDWGGEQ